MRFFPALGVVSSLLAPLVLGDLSVGYTPSGKAIFSLPPGSHLEQSGRNFNVVAANGTTVHVFENLIRGSGARRRMSPGMVKRQGLSVPADASASLPDNSTVQSFNATLVVPPAPTTFGSQLIFLTAGLIFYDEDAGDYLYMATGLQYGGTNFQGGPYWTSTFLMEAVPDNLFSQGDFGNPIVNPGDILHTTVGISSDLSPIPGYTWYSFGLNSTTSGEANLAYTVLFEDGPGFSLLIRGQEEGVEQASDYPAGSMVFQDLSVSLTTGVPEISWSAETNSTIVPGLGIEVQADGASDAQIAIVFPSSSS